MERVNNNCPYCHSNPSFLQRDNKFAVTCSDPHCNEIPRTDFCDTKEEAIKLWDLGCFRFPFDT